MKTTNSLSESIGKRMSQLWPSAKGSLAQVNKPCIRANCAACRDGVKHKAYVFTFYKGGKKRNMYVPLELVPLMRKAITNGREMERMLVDVGISLIKEYRGRRNRKA